MGIRMVTVAVQTSYAENKSQGLVAGRQESLFTKGFCNVMAYRPNEITLTVMAPYNRC